MEKSPDCDCRFTTYFPAEKMEDYHKLHDEYHELYNLNWTENKLAEISGDERSTFMNSLIEDLSMWLEDPILGAQGQIMKLEKEMEDLKNKNQMLENQMKKDVDNNSVSSDEDDMELEDEGPSKEEKLAEYNKQSEAYEKLLMSLQSNK